MSEQCEENPILARARTAIENGEAVNRVSALVARIEELEAAIERVRNEVFAPMMPGYTDTGKAWVDGYNSALRAVHAALDGDA
jgi:hypothetical protein